MAGPCGPWNSAGMGELWRELRQELAGLVLPGGCAGCGVPGARGELCARCAGGLAGAVPRLVRPSPAPSGLPRVYASLPYDGQVRALLLAHKERGALGLAGPLGQLLAAAVWEARAGASDSARRRAESGPLTLVPVPSARRAVARRGHDPVRRIAGVAARELRRGGAAARVLTVLRQRRTVADQAGLTARQRALNLSGALELAPGGERLLAGGMTMLVDDVMTTGASLAEATRTVVGRSQTVVAAAVVAFRQRS